MIIISEGLKASLVQTLAKLSNLLVDHQVDSLTNLKCLKVILYFCYSFNL